MDSLELEILIIDSSVLKMEVECGTKAPWAVLYLECGPLHWSREERGIVGSLLVSSGTCSRRQPLIITGT